MTSPEVDAKSPPFTGLEHLQESLAETRYTVQHRMIWDTIGAVEHHTIPDLTFQVMPRALRPRTDLDPDALERLQRTRTSTATEVARAFQRALMSSPHTLGALANATPSPVHGSERVGLTAAVRRPLISAGYAIDPTIERQVTYAVADAVGRALAKEAKFAPPIRRAGSDQPVTQLIVDHDDFDWLTGEPLAPAFASALAAVNDALASATLSAAAA